MIQSLIRFSRVSSLILFSTQALMSCCYAYEISTIHSMLEVTQHLKPKTLLVTDLDHTVMEPLTYEGSEPWFQHMYDLARPHEKKVAIDFYCRVQDSIQMRPVEPSLPLEWQKWRQCEGVALIGLTSRSYSLAAITHDDLSQLGMTFPDTWLVDTEIPGVAYDGILFASGRNKGEIMDLFLQTHPQYQSWQIIFIDDSYHHLEFVGKILEEKYSATPKPLLFHYPTSRNRYDKARFISPISDKAP